jgi:hypothetical protein
MKIASTAKPTGYSGIGGAVTVKGKLPAMRVGEVTAKQYEPGLSEEVG